MHQSISNHYDGWWDYATVVPLPPPSCIISLWIYGISEAKSLWAPCNLIEPGERIWCTEMLKKQKLRGFQHYILRTFSTHNSLSSVIRFACRNQISRSHGDTHSIVQSLVHVIGSRICRRDVFMCEIKSDVAVADLGLLSKHSWCKSPRSLAHEMFCCLRQSWKRFRRAVLMQKKVILTSRSQLITWRRQVQCFMNVA